MGTIEHRGKNSWRIGVQVKTSNGWQWIRIPLHMDPSHPEDVQRRDAERELKALEKRLAGEQASTWTLSAWADEWLLKHVAPDMSPVTVANYRHLLKARILPMLGGRDLTELTPPVLTDWLIAVRNSPRRTTAKDDAQLARPRAPSDRLKPAAKAKPLSANTVLHYYTCMEAMLSAAVRMGYLESNPMQAVPRPRVRTKRPVRMTEDEARQLLTGIGRDDARLLVAVLLGMICGMRLGEVTELMWTDIDWQGRTVDVSRALKYTPETGSFVAEPKSDAGRRLITLPAAMMPVLQQLRFQRTEDALAADDAGRPWHGARYILYGRNGDRLHHDTPSKWFRVYADAHGYPDLTFHDLRHVHASLLLAHNIDPVSVAARMGHSDPSITLKVYSYALPARDQDAAAYLDHILAAHDPAQLPAAAPVDPDQTSPAAAPARLPDQTAAVDPDQTAPVDPDQDPPEDPRAAPDQTAPVS